MLNRRHIRTKVMQVIYASKSNATIDLEGLEDLLASSMNDLMDLYLLMLTMLSELQTKSIEHLKKIQQKHLPTKSEINPSTKFIDNPVLLQIKQSSEVKALVSQRKLKHWSNDSEYVDLLFKAVLKSEAYKQYMTSTETSYNHHAKFIVKIYSEIIATNEKLYDYLEDKCLTWVDDLPVINTTIVKLISKSKANSSSSYYTPSLFKNKDDQQFGLDLFKKTVSNLEQLSSEISSKTQNWDPDRIADIDFVLLKMAICELFLFPSIPIKVTINEYLEIAKEYSTPKSNVFINGVLDKVAKEYKDSERFNKIGRGLM